MNTTIVVFHKFFENFETNENLKFVIDDVHFKTFNFVAHKDKIHANVFVDIEFQIFFYVVMYKIVRKSIKNNKNIVKFLFRKFFHTNITKIVH